jgi:hypothetical protein
LIISPLSKFNSPTSLDENVYRARTLVAELISNGGGVGSRGGATGAGDAENCCGLGNDL